MPATGTTAVRTVAAMTVRDRSKNVRSKVCSSDDAAANHPVAISAAAVAAARPAAEMTVQAVFTERERCDHRMVFKTELAPRLYVIFYTFFIIGK